MSGVILCTVLMGLNDYMIYRKIESFSSLSFNISNIDSCAALCIAYLKQPSIPESASLDILSRSVVSLSKILTYALRQIGFSSEDLEINRKDIQNNSQRAELKIFLQETTINFLARTGNRARLYKCKYMELDENGLLNLIKNGNFYSITDFKNKADTLFRVSRARYAKYPSLKVNILRQNPNFVQLRTYIVTDSNGNEDVMGSLPEVLTFNLLNLLGFRFTTQYTALTVQYLEDKSKYKKPRKIDFIIYDNENNPTHGLEVAQNGKEKSGARAVTYHERTEAKEEEFKPLPFPVLFLNSNMSHRNFFLKLQSYIDVTFDITFEYQPVFAECFYFSRPNYVKYLDYTLEMLVEYILSDKIDGVANLQNKHSSLNTYLKSNHESYNEAIKVAKSCREVKRIKSYVNTRKNNRDEKYSYLQEKSPFEIASSLITDDKIFYSAQITPGLRGFLERMDVYDEVKRQLSEPSTLKREIRSKLQGIQLNSAPAKIAEDIFRIGKTNKYSDLNALARSVYHKLKEHPRLSEIKRCLKDI